MSGTPGGSVSVALGALHSDAQKWSTASQNVSNAQSTVGTQYLTAQQLSCYADAQGFTQTYDALQQRIYQLLGQAATNFNNISTTLQQVATTYEKTENKITNNFNRIHH